MGQTLIECKSESKEFVLISSTESCQGLMFRDQFPGHLWGAHCSLLHSGLVDFRDPCVSLTFLIHEIMTIMCMLEN